MKKLLIASTALVATSGFAYAAELDFGGSAQFGVIYQEDRADPSAGEGTIAADETEELFLDYELQFDFSAAGETDSGFGFGASVELESDSDAKGNQNGQAIDPEIFMSGNFGTLTIGALDIAPDSAGFGNTRDPGYDGIGIDNNIDALLFLNAQELVDGNESGQANMVYEGAFGGLSLILSAHSHEGDYGIVADYDFGSFNVGVSYVEVDETVVSGTAGGLDSLGFTVGGSFGGFDLDFVYVDSSSDFDLDAEGYGLSGAYDLGAFDLTFAYNAVEVDQAGGGSNDGASYGVGIAYDLGGGAALQAGVGSQYDFGTDEDRTVASFGVAIGF